MTTDFEKDCQAFEKDARKRFKKEGVSMIIRGNLDATFKTKTSRISSSCYVQKETVRIRFWVGEGKLEEVLLNCIKEYWEGFFRIKGKTVLEFSFPFLFQNHDPNYFLINKESIFTFLDREHPFFVLSSSLQSLFEGLKDSYSTFDYQIEFSHQPEPQLSVDYFVYGQRYSLVFDIEDGKAVCQKESLFSPEDAVHYLQTTIPSLYQTKRIASALEPPRYHFEQLLNHFCVWEPEKQDQFYRYLCEQTGSLDVEDECARILSDPSCLIHFQTHQQTYSFFPFLSGWIVIHNKTITFFSTFKEAKEKLEYETLSYMMGKTTWSRYGDLIKKNHPN